MTREIKFRVRANIRVMENEYKFSIRVKTLIISLYELTNNTIKSIISKNLLENEYFERVISWDEYTGLNDKHNIDIYERDVLAVPFVEFQLGTQIRNWKIEWGEHSAMWLAFRINTDLREDASCVKHGEIIGNTYDNPELLGGNEE